MTYAPATLKAVVNLLHTVYGVPMAGLGVVGDSNHRRGYHCGLDTLAVGRNDYSCQHSRDKAGLARWPNAASALDVTSSWKLHNTWIRNLVRDYQARAPYTHSIRDIITSFDGRNVVGFSDLSGRKQIDDYGDDSHRWHTHISRWRDAHDDDVIDWITIPLGGRVTTYKRLPDSVLKGRTIAEIAAKDKNAEILVNLPAEQWGRIEPGAGGPQTSPGFDLLHPEWIGPYWTWPSMNSQATYVRGLHAILSRYAMFDTYEELIEMWRAEVGSQTLKMVDYLIKVAGGSTPTNGKERGVLLGVALGAPWKGASK